MDCNGFYWILMDFTEFDYTIGFNWICIYLYSFSQL